MCQNKRVAFKTGEWHSIRACGLRPNFCGGKKRVVLIAGHELFHACHQYNGRVEFTTGAHNKKARAWNLQRACGINNKRVVLATCILNLKTGLWNFTTSK
jgi:hypothetical protein